MRICLDSPVPSIDTVMASFKSLLVFPPAIPQLPKLPFLPNPIYAGLSLPSLEMVTTALELQAFQLQNTLLNMVKPMLSLLGMSIESFLPKIPGLDLTLLDLLMGTPEKVLAAVRAAIANGIQLPCLPVPFYASVVEPITQAVQAMQMMVANYMQLLTTKVVALIKMVTDKLKIGMPAFPTMPTAEEIMAALLGLVPGVPDIAALVNKFRTKMSELFAMMAALSFPGLPPMPMLPWPLIPGFRLPDLEFNLNLIALQNSLTTGLMKIIMDFIESTLKKFLGFSFPLICIDLPDPPTMPTLPTMPA